jgi:uncharacterized membrane protein YhaH (DUF805 family)
VGNVLSYLSFRGRASRQRFWLTALALWAIIFVGAIVAVMLSNVSPLLSVLFLPLYLAVLVAALANSTRRLHDRNKSAWWLIVFLGIPLCFSLFGAMGAAGGGPADAANFISVLGLPFSIWGLVVMGFLKGTDGPNKYGDDPLGSPAVEVYA